LTVGNGFLDHATWHCFGLYDVASGMAQRQGYCVATDPAGDQVVSNVASNGKYAADAKSFNGTGTFTTGTGKYAGVSGGWTMVGHVPEFRTAVPESTYVQYGPLQGSYKIAPEATGSSAPPTTNDQQVDSIQIARRCRCDGDDSADASRNNDGHALSPRLRRYDDAVLGPAFAASRALRAVAQQL
jgi:hypothetical protein